jgi:hypothetical protein
MSPLQAFFFGMIVAWIPSLLLLAWMSRTAAAESTVGRPILPCREGSADASRASGGRHPRTHLDEAILPRLRSR